jgi:4-amino-4-deoxy-L-arabinose transferase-like glycosyltransferase
MSGAPRNWPGAYRAGPDGAGNDRAGPALSATGLASPWPLLLLACATVYALRLACSAASGASLHVDEAQYWDWSRDLQWGYYSKPPVIAALIAASRALFGDSEVGLRALAMAGYPLAALVLAALARDMAGPGAAGAAASRWAAAIFLASPLAALLGLVATTDAPLLLCWSAALAGLWLAVQRQRRWGWALFALAAGVGLLSKYTLAAVIAGAWLWVLLHHHRQLPALALATAVALLLFAPHLAWNAQAGWPTLRHTAEITVAAGPRAGGWLSLVGFMAAQVLVFAPLAVPVALWSQRHSAAWPAVPGDAKRFLLWTTLPLLMAGALQAWRSGAQLNWVAPAHLATALAWALLLAASPARLQRRLALALVLQALLLGGLTLAPHAAAASGRPWPLLLDPWARMRGWQQALDDVAQALPAHTPVVVVGASRTVMAQAAYHWRDRAIPRMAWFDAPVARHHYQLACPYAPGPDRLPQVWVLADGPLPDDLRSRLGPLVPLVTAVVARTPSRRIELQLLQAGAAGGVAPRASLCP